MMSNEEEKRCPLCAEELDWTDQQFKPCKCGYQVCVWCWHHIIDMAMKDETEGRCPACRSVYEKEKIVAMQANCERMVSKCSIRTTRQPKVKPKTNEVKKDLTNIRVIQRKMVYVIGLPLSLADEDVLQRKEYFGQYGNVTKVSLSRTAGGAIQQFVNDTCSAYITYSKEEEALCCIQSVHGFVLEDRILRASFGTAKYCHAWLKNMPCTNSACLYLHNIGVDEDSFGKGEVAAVHTRSRVQEIVGATNTAVKRSGSVLPPPGDDLYHSTDMFHDKSTIESPVPDGAPRSIDPTCSLPFKERGVTAVPHKMTTFVDIVGRSNSIGSEDGSIPEDRRISNLSTELSSVTIGGDIPPVEPYSVPTLFKASSTNHIGNGLFRNIPDEPLCEDPLIARQRMKDTSTSSQRACFLHPSNSLSILEDTGGPTLMQKAHSRIGFSVNHNPIHNCEDGASLPIKCVNTVLNDACQEMKFQNSAKSDRIYRSSNSFSNEEIVEHLRRIDDNSLTNDEENSALNVVENSIISNLMSIDFDSYEDYITIPSGLSKLLDEPDGLHDSAWNSFKNNQSGGYSFVNQDGFASQIAGSILTDFSYKKDQYLYKPQYTGTRTQSFAPPGFPPSRDPPPGFFSSQRTGCLPSPSSGGRLVNSPLSSNMLQQSSAGFNTSIVDIDFNDPAILNCGKPTNEVKALGFETRRANTSNMNTFEDDARLRLLIQQSASACQDSKFPQMSSMQLDQSYMGSTGLYGLNGLPSRQVNQYQNYDPSSITQQKYSKGRTSNSNGWYMDEFRHKGEVDGLDKYFPGYGDIMCNSSEDVYGRVFGL